jgi:hypothetical protein
VAGAAGRAVINDRSGERALERRSRWRGATTVSPCRTVLTLIRGAFLAVEESIEELAGQLMGGH